jgi:recombinational DNA repair protein (RecF pathway)
MCVLSVTSTFNDQRIDEINKKIYVTPPEPPIHEQTIKIHQRETQQRYHDLPSQSQNHLLDEFNQELIDSELKKMTREVAGQAIQKYVRKGSKMYASFVYHEFLYV